MVTAAGLLQQTQTKQPLWRLCLGVCIPKTTLSRVEVGWASLTLQPEAAKEEELQRHHASQGYTSHTIKKPWV